jgi:hypothetical protein
MASVGKSNVVYLWIAIGILYGCKNSLNAQTCCSGGVPLSGNMGFAGAGKGTLQMELSYDLNYLSRLLMGAGPKIPLGRSNVADDRGIAYNADMQPGSGSWDLFTWMYGAWQPGFRPAGLVSGRIAAKLNGTNNQYLGSGTYQFGHTLQVYLGYGDQILLGDVMLSPSFQLHYRHSRNDRIMDVDLPNTGGQWHPAFPHIQDPGRILHSIWRHERNE